MTFNFSRWDNPEIAKVAFELPAMPYGISYSLNQTINQYFGAVREGMGGSEAEPFSAICAFAANGIPDTIAKLLIQLHHDNAGLDGDILLLVPPSDSPNALAHSESLLADLYRQMPANWEEAIEAYRSALMVENDYDRRVWNAAYTASGNGGPRIPKMVDQHMERLQDRRCNLEHILLDMPAPTLAEFAVKYLICFDSDRDLNGQHEDLCKEAKRLLQMDQDPNASELAMLLSVTDWRAAA